MSAGVQIVIGNLSFYNAILVMHLGVLHNIASSVVASIYRSGHVDRTLGPDVTADVERDGESSEPLPAHVHAMRYRTVLSMVQKQLALPLYLQHIVVWGFCFIVCFLPTSSWNQSECASSTHLLFFGVSIAAPRSRKLMAGETLSPSTLRYIINQTRDQVSMSLVFVLTIILALPGVIGVIFFTIRLWMERSHRFRSLIKSDRGASVAFLGPIFLSAWVYIVVTVETTIRLNPVITGGTVWTFGQVNLFLIYIRPNF